MNGSWLLVISMVDPFRVLLGCFLIPWVKTHGY